MTCDLYHKSHHNLNIINILPVLPLLQPMTVICVLLLINLQLLQRLTTFYNINYIIIVIVKNFQISQNPINVNQLETLVIETEKYEHELFHKLFTILAYSTRDCILNTTRPLIL